MHSFDSESVSVMDCGSDKLRVVFVGHDIVSGGQTLGYVGKRKEKKRNRDLVIGDELHKE